MRGTSVTESMVEQAAPAWLVALGYAATVAREDATALSDEGHWS